ncbi:MAG: hypothetical protein J0L55_13075 [Caulobacterales bacterium]|nr:hypothetical protein [Caulobacterales bacterium]
MVRNSKEFIEGLDDDRLVYLNDRKVKVVGEPVFEGSVKGMAGYFDWQTRFADDCLAENPDAGCVANASLIVPRSMEDIKTRHRAFDRFARYSYGMLGRTPDYVNTTLAGFVARSDSFEVDGDKKYAQNVINFHKEVAQKDLSLTHAIVNATIDKQHNDISGINKDLTPRVVRRTKDSIIVRGSKILATLAPFSDECFVYPSAPLPADTPKEYAIAFSIPMNTKGLITLCRDHTGIRGSMADYPFSSRFDEQDAFLIFDDVEIPLDRVFVDGSVEAYNSVPKNGWMSNILQQTTIRAAVKLEFAYDLCLRMAKILNSERRPEVQAMLGELRTYANLTRGCIKAAEDGAHEQGNGAFLLNQAPVRALKNMMPTWMLRANEIITILGSHNLLCGPNAEAFNDPELGAMFERYLPGSNGISAQERAKVFRTAWDFSGSALGARVALYERYYLTSQHSNFMLEATMSRFERKEDTLEDLFNEFARG